MFANDPREPSGSRITESGTMSNPSLVVEQEGTVRLRSEAEINEILKYRRWHSEELAKCFERFGFRRSTPDRLPDCQGEEEVQPGREEIELPGERNESESIDVFQPHRSSAPSLEEFSTVKSVNQIDEDSLPSESDKVYQRKIPAGEHSNSLYRIRHPIDQPDDLREVGESRGARGLGFDTCAERFSDGKNLGAHRDVHNGEERFICDVCDKKFKYPSELRRHQLAHTGEKPFKCNVCGKGFTQSGYLKRHRRSHTGERPFPCDVCGKRFTQSGDMRRHRRTHADKKLIACDVSHTPASS